MAQQRPISKPRARVRRASSAPQDSLDGLRAALRRFARARDWEQFHLPKNLAMALNVEAGELLEHFQWLADAQSEALAPAKRVQVGEEMADVLLYLIRLADRLDIELIAAARRKMRLNARKYPVAKARGNSRKYTEL